MLWYIIRHRSSYVVVIPMRGLSAVVRLDSLGNAKASKVGWAKGESHASFSVSYNPNDNLNKSFRTWGFSGWAYCKKGIFKCIR